MRYLIPILVLGGLIALLAIGLQHDPREVPSPLIGKPAPAFNLPLIEGASHFSNADFKGRAVLVNFFASWCEGCQVEHAYLLELARSQGVEIIGMDYKDQPEDGRSWLERHGNPYRTVALDLQGHAGLDWGVYGVPETFVVDASGTILYKQIGAMTPEAWAKIKPMLGKS